MAFVVVRIPTREKEERLYIGIRYRGGMGQSNSHDSELADAFARSNGRPAATLEEKPHGMYAWP